LIATHGVGSITGAVIPAKVVGTHFELDFPRGRFRGRSKWIPAFAGMTKKQFEAQQEPDFIGSYQRETAGIRPLPDFS
jgi:hypothetical protein